MERAREDAATIQGLQKDLEALIQVHRIGGHGPPTLLEDGAPPASVDHPKKARGSATHAIAPIEQRGRLAVAPAARLRPSQR